MGTSSHPVPPAPAAACHDPFFSMPASGVPVHAWRVIRWETDVPLGDDETELLPEMLQNVFPWQVGVPAPCRLKRIMW